MTFKNQFNIVGILLGVLVIAWAGMRSQATIAHHLPTPSEEQIPFNKISELERNHLYSPLVSKDTIIFGKKIVTSSGFDYDADSSIQKFVSAKRSLQDKKYIPADLTAIISENIVAPASMKIRAAAFEDLELLANEFASFFGKKLVIVSAYRSYSYQINLAQNCSPTLCARPGYSEHQLGLAIDIFAATTAGQFLSQREFKKYYERFIDNAHRYGRHNSYQKGVAVDTYQVEPWHRRYLGRDLATKLHNQRQTFAEWYHQHEEGIPILSGEQKLSKL